MPLARHGSNAPLRQRGFVQALWQLVGGLIVLALAARFAWWVATEENFDQVAAILWAIGFGIAYVITHDNRFVLRMAAGFGVFALISLVAVPLTWMAGSTAALLALLAAQLAFSFYAGRAISGRVLARGAVRPEGEGGAPSPPAGDVVADFGRWVLLSFGALIFFLIVPLMVLLVVSVAIALSQQEMKWLTAAWGLIGTAAFAYRFGGVKWRGIPVCAAIYLLVTGAILVADAVAGPFADGSGVQVAYTVMPGALVAAFIEVFVLRASGITNPVSSDK